MIDGYEVSSKEKPEDTRYIQDYLNMRPESTGSVSKLNIMDWIPKLYAITGN